MLLTWAVLPCLLCSSIAHAHGHLPVEWTQHRRTLMAWPDRISVYTEDQLHRARTEIAEIATIIARYEPVWLYSKSENVDSATAWIDSTNVTVHETNVEQLWVHDSGLILTTAGLNDELIGVTMNFNYWGEKLPSWRWYDRTIAHRILDEQNVAEAVAPFTSEGGALEVDGEGTLVATESSILNPNRNLRATKEDVEPLFHDLFGITKTIWLPGAEDVDLTDWHVDILTRFAPNGTVLLSSPNAATPENDIGLRAYNEAKEILQAETVAAGRTLRIVEVEQALTVPYSKVSRSEFREATSYLNYHLLNGAILISTYVEDRTDSDALRMMEEIWSPREVLNVQLDMLPCFGGAVHCATMQWPMDGVGEQSSNIRIVGVHDSG